MSDPTSVVERAAQSQAISNPEPARREAMLRTIAPWMATLDEDDVELVDTLVFHLIACRREMIKARDPDVIAALRRLRARVNATDATHGGKGG